MGEEEGGRVGEGKRKGKERLHIPPVATTIGSNSLPTQTVVCLTIYPPATVES